jgi:hypothetical protein
LEEITRVPYLISITTDIRNGGKPAITLNAGDDERLGEHLISVFFDADGNILGSEVVRLY